MSPLDAPLSVTFFPGLSGSTAREETASLLQLAGRVTTTRAAAKAGLPLIKLAAFGPERTAKGSLRHDANMVLLSGIEADYDGCAVSVDDACAALSAAGVAALVYTSPSHTTARPRWRVLCPLAEWTLPDVRRDLVGRLNAILGGVLAAESFVASQSFYFGAVDTNPPEVRLIEGRCIDALTIAPVLPPSAAGLALPPLPTGLPPDETTRAAVRAAGGLFSTADATAGGRHGALLAATATVAPFILSGHLSADNAAASLATAMADSGRDPNDGEVESALAGALRIARPYEPPTGGAEFAEVPPPAPVPARRGDYELFTPDDCENESDPGYLIKRLIAPGDVGVLLGQPGAGKSTLAPHLAYCVAQGRPFMGLRVKPGRVLYVAAEDVRGLRARFKALHRQHGAASDLRGTSCGNLRDSGEVAKLTAAVARFKPSLVILDTLAAAFAGMDENTSADMGAVVALSRGLAANGCAVVLIHHPAKDSDGTARGHGSLNGTLDFSVYLGERDGQGIVRGKLMKNRSGPLDLPIAFRSRVVTLGIDADGDPITTTLPVETLADGPAPEPLSDGQRAALVALHTLMDSDAAAAGQDGRKGVSEGAWMAECAKLSTAEDGRSRLRSARQMRAKLIEKGAVAGSDDGLFWPVRYDPNGGVWDRNNKVA